MGRIVVAGFVILLLGLWVSSGLRMQPSVARDESTVQVQLTSVAKPTPSPTP